ncbi:MAG: hypothetical protein ACLPKB_00090 [Xanthobacteraceae bacterium]
MALMIGAQIAPARAAPVSIVQGHYSELTSGTCSSAGANTSICYAYFSPIPAGELVVATSASCFIQITNASGASGLSQVLLQSGTRTSGGPVGAGWFWLPPTAMATVTVRGQSVQQFQASATSILKAYQALEVPTVMVEWTSQAAASASVACSIFGTITP